MKNHTNAHCQNTLVQLNAYIDGDLDSTLCTVLETHMEDCDDCRIVYNTLKKTIELCKSDGEKISLPHDTRQRLYAALNLEKDDNPQ